MKKNKKMRSASINRKKKQPKRQKFIVWIVLEILKLVVIDIVVKSLVGLF